MIEQLKSASEELRIAWHQYLSLCSSIDDYYRGGKVFPATHDKIVDQLNAEITFLSSYETDIKRARAIISQVRNYSLSPINKLPSEILTRIFHLLLLRERDANPIPAHCGYWGYNYPDYLAQVCSRWRRIAISCPSLWTYIDVSVDSSDLPRLARVETRAERSERLPLTVDIDDREYSFRGHCYNLYSDFWESVADRVGTLHLRLNDSTHEISSSALEKIAKNPSQGVFYRLSTDTDDSAGFITSREEYNYNPHPSSDGNWRSWGDLRVEASKSDIEAKFAGITVLHLRGCYPVWTSTAYHGLVDLRLHSINNRSVTITESQLVAILRSSPKIRILHFAVKFVAGNNTRVTPVSLNDLEVIRITSSRGYITKLFELNDVLRLFVPGSKSLRLTLELTEEEEALGALRELFVHSQVERICIKGLDSPSGQFLQVCLTPDLKVLALDSCDLSDLTEIFCPNYSSSATALNLGYWYFGSTRIERDNFQLMMDAFPERIFADKHCLVWGKSGTSSWEGSVKGTFPTVEEIDEDFVAKLIAGWDILD